MNGVVGGGFATTVYLGKDGMGNAWKGFI